jgi:hypothetical protein
MKIYNVWFDAPGVNGLTTIVCEDSTKIEDALKQKHGDRSTLKTFEEKSFHNVNMSSLSVADFLTLINK